jgi:hypothetical protein
MAATTETVPTSYEKLALELINEPEDFLRHCLPSLTRDKTTDLETSLACEKYIADHGYTILDFVRAVDLLQGYTLADTELFEDVDEDKKVTNPTLSVIFTFSVKPPSGNYKITRLGTRSLDNEEKADLGSVSVAFDKSNIDGRMLRIRKGDSFEECDTIACEFSDLGDDGVWHLKSKGNFAPSLDFAFSVEPVDETSNKTVFKGTVDGSLVGASNESSPSAPSVAIEGVLEPPKVLTANFLECLVGLCCFCCSALFRAFEREQEDGEAERARIAAQARIDAPADENAGIVQIEVPPGGIDLEAQEEDDATKKEKEEELKKKSQRKGLGVIVKHRKYDDKDPDKDNGMNGKQNDGRNVTVRSATKKGTHDKKTSSEKGEKKTTGTTKTCGTLSPELESSLLNGKLNALLAYQHLIWMDLVGDMASKASQLLLDTLPQIDPVSGRLKEVTHGIEWDSVVKSQVAQVCDTATQPTAVDVLQWRFINGLHASAMSYVQTALSNEFVALDKTRHPLAKHLVPFWDAPSAINDSLRLAFKSPLVMEAILDNAWRILAEEQAKQTMHPASHPTTITALQLQQDIREAAAKSQSQLWGYVDGLNKAERAGTLNLDQSTSAIVSSLGLAKIKADTFAPLAQPSNWPGVPTWLLLLNAGGSSQKVAAKPLDAGGPAINKQFAATWEKVQNQYADAPGVGSVSIRLQEAAPVYAYSK